MERLHLFEIHDQAWCPRTIRDVETDYLQFVSPGRWPFLDAVDGNWYGDFTLIIERWLYG